MSAFEVNLLPIKILNERVGILFFNEEKEELPYIHSSALPKNFSEDIKNGSERFWWKANADDESSAFEVDLFDNPRFAKHFYTKLVVDHFIQNGHVTNRNFVKDVEIFLEDQSFRNGEYKRYDRFSLRIDFNSLIEGPSLLVSFDGCSYVLNKSLEQLALPVDILGKIKYGNKIIKYSHLLDHEITDTANIFPVLNREIENFTGIRRPPRNYNENRYRKSYEQINRFYERFLRNVVIGNQIEFFTTGFFKPYEERLGRTSEDSNLLVFGNNKKHFTPYIGLKEYGPIESPTDKPIKFIFIFHEEDKGIANKLYSYFKKGYKSFPGLESFVQIVFSVDTARSIKFQKNNPIDEIKAAFDELEYDTEAFSYVAVYLSRIKKDTKDPEEEAVYFQLKELLLSRGITSQVIYRDNIENPSFNYFLPNISIALLAKLGGIPWRLYRPVKNDLVIGIGADRAFAVGDKFVGCAFCFRNDGRFKGFNAFEKNNTEALAEGIQNAINQYIEQNQDVERLVLHYYKNISGKEEEPIRRVLEQLNLSIPYIVVTVNDTASKDYVLFDTSFDGKMPQSGTFVKTKFNEFILCNNTRYSKNTGTKIDGFPFPVKIKFKSGNHQKNLDMIVIEDLIDQVYQFSRMYWKSVRQRNMPVTIEYSKIIAEMLGRFENKELGDFARNSLWFL